MLDSLGPQRVLRNFSTSRLCCNTPYPTLFTHRWAHTAPPVIAKSSMTLRSRQTPYLRTGSSEDSLRKLTAAISLFRRRQAPSSRQGICTSTQKGSSSVASSLTPRSLSDFRFLRRQESISPKHGCPQSLSRLLQFAYNSAGVLDFSPQVQHVSARVPDSILRRKE